MTERPPSPKMTDHDLRAIRNLLWRECGAVVVELDDLAQEHRGKQRAS